MNTKTRFQTVVAAAAFSFTSFLTLGACHVADPNGEPGFPTDVAKDVPNKDKIVLDIYAMDNGQMTNGNDVSCVWSCEIYDGTSTTHKFDNCTFNEALSVKENTHEVEDQPKADAEARAKSAVNACNQKDLPPGTHSFRLRNLASGFYLFNLTVQYTERLVTIMHGGANDWRDMCIARHASDCHSPAMNGDTDTDSGSASDSDSETDTNGDGCGGTCTDTQVCENGMCVDLPQVDLCDPVQWLGHHQMGSNVTELYLPDLIGDHFGRPIEDCDYMGEKQELLLSFAFMYDGGPNAPVQQGITYDPANLMVECDHAIHSIEPGNEDGSQATVKVIHPLDLEGGKEDADFVLKFDCYGKPVDGGPNG